MTKGALIAFAFFFVVVVAGFVRIEQIASDVRVVANEAKAVAFQNKGTLKEVQAQARRNASALREVCRQTDTIQALTEGTVALFKFDIDEHVVPRRAIPAYMRALRTFSGFSEILNERPACTRVLKP